MFSFRRHWTMKPDLSFLFTLFEKLLRCSLNLYFTMTNYRISNQDSSNALCRYWFFFTRLTFANIYRERFFLLVDSLDGRRFELSIRVAYVPETRRWPERRGSAGTKTRPFPSPRGEPSPSSASSGPAFLAARPPFGSSQQTACCWTAPCSPCAVLSALPVDLDVTREK